MNVDFCYRLPVTGDLRQGLELQTIDNKLETSP
jgi:hypothetical protein